MPLLYFLRNILEYNGAKYGCGLGQYGSCMVIINGHARPSCLVPCNTLKGKGVITLESMASNDKLDPIQEAFCQNQAAQCGYCLNGMVMAAKALLGPWRIFRWQLQKCRSLI